ncbi:MAG: rod shape-determining protein MreD [Candidatus Moranbacteria bacterium]|jgi:rod shape-determining protein MreD|nr:rod shape-determining protein MreD [Candidatus Moranbacteria bacterium]
MEKFFFRLAAIATIVFLQAYFFASFSFQGCVVSFALMAAVAWTIISGFEKAWVYAISLGILVDLLAFDAVGKNAILFIFAVYIVSFISRRLLIESQGWSFLLVFLLIISVTFFNNFLVINFFSWQGGAVEFFSGGMASFFKGVLTGSFCNIITFYFLYWAIGRMEKRLAFYESAVNIK